MRYRINNFLVSRTAGSDTVTITVKIPSKLHSTLQVQSGTSRLIGSQEQSIKNSIRLIADETTGGTILYATGSKMVGSTDPITSIEKLTNNQIKITFSLTSLIAAATADGDTDEVTALGNLFGGEESIGHLWTIEFDFGDTPEDLQEPNAKLVVDFLGIVETPDEEVMSESEAIGILEDTWLAVTGSAAPHTDDWDGSGSGSGSEE